MSTTLILKWPTCFCLENACLDSNTTCSFVKFYSYIHLVEQVPLPPSVLYTVYDQTQQNMEMTTVTRLIDTVKLGVFIDNLLPVTFFSAVNEAWDVIIPVLEIEDVIKNMVFELLWFDDMLADMHGEFLTSTNGKKWNIEVYDDPDGAPLLYAQNRTAPKIYFTNAEGPAGLTNCSFIPGPNRTNILARTGVIHHIDCLFLDFNYTKEDPNAPTFAPIAAAAPSPPTPFASFTSVPLVPTPAPVFTVPPGPGQAASSATSSMFPRVLATVIAVAVAAALYI